MYQTILLDLDETLTDPGSDITNSVRYALEQFKINLTTAAMLGDREHHMPGDRGNGIPGLVWTAVAGIVGNWSPP